MSERRRNQGKRKEGRKVVNEKALVRDAANGFCIAGCIRYNKYNRFGNTLQPIHCSTGMVKGQFHILLVRVTH